MEPAGEASKAEHEPAALLSLPNEILDEIVSYLPFGRGLASLACANWRLARLYTSRLHWLGVEQNGGLDALRHALLTEDHQKFRILAMKYKADVKTLVMTPLWPSARYWPLHHAVLSGNKNTVMLMLANGAKLNVGDEAGCWPICYARTPKMARLLLNSHMDLDNWIFQVCHLELYLDARSDDRSAWSYWKGPDAKARDVHKIIDMFEAAGKKWDKKIVEEIKEKEKQFASKRGLKRCQQKERKEEQKRSLKKKMAKKN